MTDNNAYIRTDNAFDRAYILLQENFKDMTRDEPAVYHLDCDTDELWDIYLNSFPEGYNPMYRKRKQLDCSACRHFFRQMANVAVIEGGKLRTIWKMDAEDEGFQKVFDALDAHLMTHPILELFVSKEKRKGYGESHVMEDGEVVTYHHFHIDLPDYLVDKSGRSEEQIRGEFRTNRYNTLRNALGYADNGTENISLEAIEIAVEMLGTNDREAELMNAGSHRNVTRIFRDLKKAYLELNEADHDIFLWDQAAKNGGAVCGIRNTSIGAFMQEVTKGTFIEDARDKYNAMEDPEHKNRPKAVVSQAALKAALNAIQKLGYEASMPHEHAKPEDLSVTNVYYVNRNTRPRLEKQGLMESLFAELREEVESDPRKFSNVTEVSVEDFVKNILPNANSAELFLENRLANRMVTLMAPVNRDAKPMYKWNNNFGIAYRGNLTDSKIRENVKLAGGSVDGVLRFSPQWNDIELDRNDLDAHCIEPDGEHIHFRNKRSLLSGGNLDVDIISPVKGTPAVENITWPALNRMRPGNYQFYVHCYSNNGGRSGFRAEIEFGGNLYQFAYNQPLRTDEKIPVADVYYDGHGNFTLKTHLTAETSSREVWGLKTNRFVPITVACPSPNFWDDANGTGDLHYLFMLADCRNDEPLNAFFNAYLPHELAPHRKILEALANRMVVPFTEDQLSGVGFSSTRREHFYVRVKGALDRIYKVNV